MNLEHLWSKHIYILINVPWKSFVGLSSACSYSIHPGALKFTLIHYAPASAILFVTEISFWFTNLINLENKNNEINVKSHSTPTNSLGFLYIYTMYNYKYIYTHINVRWSKVAIRVMVIPPLLGNPYGYINPYYKVPWPSLLEENTGSLDPSTSATAHRTRVRLHGLGQVLLCEFDTKALKIMTP